MDAHSQHCAKPQVIQANFQSFQPSSVIGGQKDWKFAWINWVFAQGYEWEAAVVFFFFCLVRSNLFQKHRCNQHFSYTAVFLDLLPTSEQQFTCNTNSHRCYILARWWISYWFMYFLFLFFFFLNSATILISSFLGGFIIDSCMPHTLFLLVRNTLVIIHIRQTSQ